MPAAGRGGRGGRAGDQMHVSLPHTFATHLIVNAETDARGGRGGRAGDQMHASVPHTFATHLIAEVFASWDAIRCMPPLVALRCHRRLCA